MGEVVKLSDKFPNRKIPDVKNIQYSFPFMESDKSATIIIVKAEKLQPNTTRSFLVNNNISCIADLRHLPFFSGKNKRHSKIVQILYDLQIPLFHIGAVLRDIVDTGLPFSIKFHSLIELIEDNQPVKNTFIDMLSLGHCAIIVDLDEEEKEFLELFIYIIMYYKNDAKLILNEEYKYYY